MNDELTLRIASLNAAVAARPGAPDREIFETMQRFAQYLCVPTPDTAPLMLDEAARRLDAAWQLAKEAIEHPSQRAHELASHELSAARQLLNVVAVGTPGRVVLHERAKAVLDLLAQKVPR